MAIFVVNVNMESLWFAAAIFGGSRMGTVASAYGHGDFQQKGKMAAKG